MSTSQTTRPGAILLDIEGTTTPVAFVTQVLVPYARIHLRSHLEEHAGEPEYESIVVGLRLEHALAVRAGEEAPEDTAAFVEWLMDRDRKSSALKELQGRIWEHGYRHGALLGEVFPDVRSVLERWYEHDVPVGIFSSGSVLAQQLLFRHSTAGDLTPFLRWYFDTRVGSKIDAESYRRIAASSRIAAETFLFLSDAIRELEAASTAGMQVRLVVRPGNAPAAASHGYQTIRSLDEVDSPSREVKFL